MNQSTCEQGEQGRGPDNGMEFSGINISLDIFNGSGQCNWTLIAGTSNPHSLYYLLAVSLICVVGSGGNILVLLSIIKEKKLRTVANYLIGNVALVDMLTCGIILPSNLLAASGRTSATICGLTAYTFALFPNLSIQGQCLISINRYVLVTKPIGVYRSMFNKTRTFAAVLTIWILNVLSMLAIILFAAKPITEETDLCDTSADPTGTRNINHYILSLTCVLTFTTSFVFYGMLIQFVRRNPMSLTVVKRADSKASMTLLGLLIPFAVSLIISPLLLFLNQELAFDSRGILDEVASCVMFANYAVNPIFYGFRIRPFQQTYAKLLCSCVPKKRITPDESNEPTRSTGI